MNTVIDQLTQPSVAVADSQDRFPVHRIYCVGRNYAAHAREMGHDPDREDPFFFCKPSDAVVPSGSAIPFPVMTSDLHHEIELVAAIGKGGSGISVENALGHVWGYAVGIDLTRRDLQGEAKKLGRPWDTGKAFDNAAPIAPIHPVSEVGHLSKGRIWLQVNGEARQDSDLTHLIWSVPETISVLSNLFTLQPGDLIFTGTPEGVGPIPAGAKVTGGIDGLTGIEITIG